MAQRKASKGKRTRAKASRARTTPKRKAASKTPPRKTAVARRAAPEAGRRIAQLEAENRRLREELDRLRAGRGEPAVVEAEAKGGGEADEDDIPTLGL